MKRAALIFLLAAVGIFWLDQSTKALFLQGFYQEGRCIDLVLHMNKGVAFSFLSFLGPHLKWVQLLAVVALVVFIVYERLLWRYPFVVGLLMGGALGNLYDRFIHGAVVDFIAWHCGFRWPVFNIADVAIDIAVVWLLWIYLFRAKKEKQ